MLTVLPIGTYEIFVANVCANEHATFHDFRKFSLHSPEEGLYRL